jgi:hypothetical protein
VLFNYLISEFGYSLKFTFGRYLTSKLISMMINMSNAPIVRIFVGKYAYLKKIKVLYYWKLNLENFLCIKKVFSHQKSIKINNDYEQTTKQANSFKKQSIIFIETTTHLSHSNALE